MEIVFRNMQISFKDYATINFKYLLRKQKLRLLVTPIICLVIILANFYNAGNRAASENGPGWYMNWLYALAIVLVIGLIPYYLRRAWRKRYDTTQFLQSPATFTFTDKGISVDAPTVQGAASWETIDSLFLMKELALLTTRNLTVYFLDFRCLEAPATEADFLALVRQHNVPIK